MKVFGLLFVFAVANALPTTVEVLTGDGRFTTLLDLVTQVGLVDTLNNGTYTIFAPTDSAFADFPTLDDLKNNVTMLTDFLLYHVTSDQFLRASAIHELVLNMANGKDARINKYDYTITIQGSHIVTFDMMASNGVIQAIANVIEAPEYDIMGYLAANSQLSTFLSLVKQAGMESTLQADGLTLFAPNNVAFDRATEEKMTDITSNQAHLVDFLKYHIVDNTQYERGLYQRKHLTTLDPNHPLIVHFAHNHHTFKVSASLVTQRDIGVTNGVVYIVNNVVLPEQDPLVVG